MSWDGAVASTGSEWMWSALRSSQPWREIVPLRCAAPCRFSHITHPYPSEAEKQQLAQVKTETLQSSQVGEAGKNRLRTTLVCERSIALVACRQPQLRAHAPLPCCC